LNIEVNDLSKKYGEQLAVNNISFSVPKGEIVGFLGPNGAGKSTTMKILTCFIPPTSGSASICGFDTSEQSLEVRKRVGYLPEHNPLYLDMYVKEYLRFAGELGRISGVKNRVEEVIQMTGLGREQHKRIKELSKGYRQRVGLAQAIIHNPEVLILDEPTSGLDPNQVLEIRDLIRNLGQEKTILISTHIMQEVEAICDRAIIIDRGNIVADNSLENLRKTSEGVVSIRVQFGSEVQAKDFKNIVGFQQATALGNNTWRIEGQHPEFRQQVSHFALAANLEVLELVTEKNSLEEIFRKLTAHVGHI
jgi:ABC-2 type transport system ATP-binding protein